MARHYLVTYDVSDDRRRDKVFRTLEGFGDHIQYSVFICQLSSKEIVTLKTRLKNHVHHDEDQILILDLGKSVHPLDTIVQSVGRGFKPTARAIVI